jgi:hypothetical protein
MKTFPLGSTVLAGVAHLPRAAARGVGVVLGVIGLALRRARRRG